MLKPPWTHTSPSVPCPICGRNKRGGRCILIPGQVVLCYYAVSKHARKTTAGDAWLHFLADVGPRPHRAILTATAGGRLATPRRNDLHLLAQKFRSCITAARLRVLARDLGVSEEALMRLEVGWSDGEPMFVAARDRYVPIHAWSFPRRNAAGKVTGLSMRPQWGRKFTFTGSGGGLHIPSGFIGGGRAFLCEGPSDTAAAIDLLGLNVFGRTSCNSDVEEVAAFARSQALEELVIFSQRDEAHHRLDGSVYYPAQDGAEALAVQGYVRAVRVIMPPHHPGEKDVRDWKRRGATAADVERLIREASPRRLAIAVHIRRRKGNGVCHTIQK